MSRSLTVVVFGLGYVGLPLAVALAPHFNVIGFDVDAGRIAELRDGTDRTNEVEAERLLAAPITLTDDIGACAGADVYIVAVPTPVDRENRPDLAALLSATRMIGPLLDRTKRPTIIFESTVYPGVTDDICGPALETASGLRRGVDFRLGYSPERINPGDRQHTIDKITKVISGEDDEVVEQLAGLYGAITSGGTFRAASIKAAEAAKAIENAQRDINIAFMNEVAQIVAPLGVSVWDVLAAAGSKWNFLPFEPGLVGGHCIGVDPYYLSHLAQQVGLDPKVILAGRGTNDQMGRWIADQLHAERGGPGSVLLLGLTFKENVPDLRNSRSFDLIDRLRELGHEVAVADPLASPGELETHYGLTMTDIAVSGSFDLVIGAVKHDAYAGMSDSALERLVSDGGTIADLKAMWRDRPLRDRHRYWSL